MILTCAQKQSWLFIINIGRLNRFLANQTEFPIEIFLWRKRQCHQNTDIDNTHCQSIIATAKFS